MTSEQVMALFGMFVVGAFFSMVATNRFESKRVRVAGALLALAFGGPPVVYLWITGVFG